MEQNVILLMARHTWQKAFASKVIFVLMFVISAMLAFALFHSWKSYVTQNQINGRYQEEAYRDFVNNPDKHPHRMAHYGHFAFRQKTPLSVFDHGLESFMGNAVYLEAHVQNTTNFSDAGLSTGLLRFGQVSISMVLQLLIPLFIFFLGFDAISGDRESGTLKILFGQGVDWKSLIIGKSLGLLAIILAFLLPVFLCFLIVSLFVLDIPFSVDDALRMLFLVFFYLAFLSLCSFITVWMSAWCSNSKSSLVSLIGIWLLFAIVLPRSVQSLGTLIYETPSKAAFAKSLEEDILKEGDSHDPDDPHYKALKDSLLSVYGVDSVSKLPFNYMGFQIQEAERISAAIYNHHYGKLLTLYDRQNALSKVEGLFNPFMAIKNISMALSNTDYSAYIDFQKQAENYRYAFVSRMNEFHMKDISNEAVTSAGKTHVSDHSRWAEVEQFDYHAPQISTVFKNEIISIVAFSGWLATMALCISTFTKKLKVL